MRLRLAGWWVGLAVLAVAAVGPGASAAAELQDGVTGGGTPAVVVTVDAARRLGPYLPVWNYFGADEPNYPAEPNGRKLLRELHDLSPAAPVYVRLHNLLTTGNGVGSRKWGSTNAYTEDAQGRPVYDWTITDRIFDAMRDAGVRPEVEIGFMPEALSTHPEPYRHTFPKGEVFTGWSYPPKDYARWGALVRAYVTHLHGRYGAAVDGWLWEVWNEPDIAYWHGTPEEYDRLYDVTAAAVRGVLPGAKVGGPESTGPYGGRSEAFLRQFLEHCARGKNAATGGVGAPLDFISFHPKGEPRVVDGHVQMDVGHQLRAVDAGMKVVASFPEWRSTPIVMGESDPEGCAACGVDQSPQNGYRNGPLYGVSVAEATARSYELARRDGVKLQGAVTWAFEFENEPPFAGYRELATDGIDKAVLNVFRLWGMLGGEWVEARSTGALALDEVLRGGAAKSSDVSAVATRRPDGEVDVLLWNYDDRDVPGPAAEVTVRVAGAGDGRGVRVRQLVVDREHANAYAAWLGMGSPKVLGGEERARLLAASRLEETEVAGSAVQVRNGAVEARLRVERQGVVLLRVTRR